MILLMRIGLAQDNLDAGSNLLMEMSDPRSSRYGQHYTAEEIIDIFAPRNEIVHAVLSWLESSGIEAGCISQSTNKGWIQFDAPAEDAEQLLSTMFHFFEHGSSGDLNVACDEYSVLHAERDHIDYITPGVKLITTGRGKKSKRYAPKKRRSVLRRDTYDPNSLSDCNQAITPTCIRAAYDIPFGDKADPNNQLGVFDQEFPAIKNGTKTKFNSVDGGVVLNKTTDVFESDLDFELALPISFPQTSVLFHVDDEFCIVQSKYLGLFNNFLDAIDGSYCTYSYGNKTGNNPEYDSSYPDEEDGGYKGQLQCGVYKPTNVISVSYGLNEADFRATYQRRQCNKWKKLALQGESVVLSSGDSGVGGRLDQGGHADGCLGNSSTVFNPTYPATCPYITVVGATELPSGANVKDHQEVASEYFPSGGGFSNLYETPSYQGNVTAEYLANAPANVQACKSYSIKNGDAVGANGGI